MNFKLENPITACRVCLKSAENMIGIFEGIPSLNKMFVSYSEMLMECASVTVSIVT